MLRSDDAYENGYEIGYGDAIATMGRLLRAQDMDLDLALGEATRLADEIDVLKKQLDLATTDDLE